MEQVKIAVGSPADRLLVAGLGEIETLLSRLGDSYLVVGGLMTKAWLHARPIGIEPRATADLDLGIDKQSLRLFGERRVIGPALRELDFQQKMGDEEFRFSKDIDEGEFLVDLLVPSGSSREEPPLLEAGMPSLAAPGLAYAISRGPVKFQIDFQDPERDSDEHFDLNLPSLDAAFVSKAALVQRGIRKLASRRQRDTVDAVFLAAACLGDEPAIQAITTHKTQSEVKDALRWMKESISSPSSAAARRVHDHFESDLGRSDGGEWAASVALRFNERIA